MQRRRWGLGLALGLMLTSACGGADDGGEPAAMPPAFEAADVPLPVLSDYGFFVGELAELQPAPRVFEYSVAAPLFADNAAKGRFIYLPEGAQMTMTEIDEWDVPVGAVVIKTFYFDNGEGFDIIETRLLQHTPDGWKSHIYQWDETQTEAEHIRAGADVTVHATAPDGTTSEQLYLVPDENACDRCHERSDVLRLLGITTHQLNRTIERDGETVEQITWMAEQGIIAGDPPDPASLPAFVDPAGDADLDRRARAYLHGNCAHCHRSGGGGGASGLSFLAWEDNPLSFGVCKVPAAAGPGAGGRPLDIIPGDPDRSIVVYRMDSTDPEIKMPEVPSLLSDDFGVELVTEWIAAMPPDDCGVPAQ